MLLRNILKISFILLYFSLFISALKNHEKKAKKRNHRRSVGNVGSKKLRKWLNLCSFIDHCMSDILFHFRFQIFQILAHDDIHNKFIQFSGFKAPCHLLEVNQKIPFSFIFVFIGSIRRNKCRLRNSLDTRCCSDCSFCKIF